jgi:hypothetical protein
MCRRPAHAERRKPDDARGDHERDQQVEHDGLAHRRVAVPAARHLHRVEGRPRALLDHLGRGPRVLGDDAPAPQLADLSCDDGADGRERDDPHHDGPALEAIELSQPFNHRSPR